MSFELPRQPQERPFLVTRDMMALDALKVHAKLRTLVNGNGSLFKAHQGFCSSVGDAQASYMFTFTRTVCGSMHVKLVQWSEARAHIRIHLGSLR